MGFKENKLIGERKRQGGGMDVQDGRAAGKQGWIWARSA
jgi:hypothetical protein